MDSTLVRSLVSTVILTASACATSETQTATRAPSPVPSPQAGPIAAAAPEEVPEPAVPFAMPHGFEPVDRPALVATVGDRLVLLRLLRRCERVAGASGTIRLPRLGTGTYTAPGSSFRSCDTWIEALDRDGAPVWKSPTQLAHPFATVLGDRLLAAGPGGLTLYAVATGARLASVADPVIGREACVDAPHGRVFVNDWDDRTRDAVVDLATMQVRPAGAERCPVKPFTQCDDATAIACFEERDERRRPTTPVAGFYEAATLRDATDEALIGRSTRGRKLPMVVAVDPKTHAERWSLVVPPPDTRAQAGEDQLFPHRFADIAGGKLFIEYDAWASHPHLAAFDMKDGARLWDVPVERFAPFTPTADRVYVNTPDGMRVLDATTGEVARLAR